jgi:hypothetical protein
VKELRSKYPALLGPNVVEEAQVAELSMIDGTRCLCSSMYITDKGSGGEAHAIG